MELMHNTDLNKATGGIFWIRTNLTTDFRFNRNPPKIFMNTCLEEMKIRLMTQGLEVGDYIGSVPEKPFLKRYSLRKLV